MNKKGFELAIGFIVTLIITLVIFSGSIYFVGQFFKTATETQEEIDSQTEAEIQALLSDGSPIAIPLSKKNLLRGKSDIIWLGIRNILDEETDFYTKVCLSNAFDVEENVITLAEAGYIETNWILYKEGPHTIGKDKFKTINLLFRVDDKFTFAGDGTQKGTYTFNVYVATSQIPDSCNTLTTTSIGTLTSEAFGYLYYDQRPRRVIIVV